MHATAFLKAPDKQATGPLVVLYGDERFLKQAALQAVSSVVLGEDDAGLSRFAGKDADLKSVLDELATVSMWGERRLVVVEDAEEFVSKHRAALEKYLEKPAKKSVLLLDVKSWPKTTRLAKGVAKIGLDLECKPLGAGELVRWLGEMSKQQYGKQLTREAAQLMVELAGESLGLLDQELAKLAAYVGERARIGPEDVSALVGGWKAETTWVMIDALQAGHLALALSCLDKLLTAGEAPQKLLGGINVTFRKLAQATELARQGTALQSALREAGVFPKNIELSARYLRRIGRPRAEMLYQWLIEADGDMKGNSRLPERVQLENLLVRLSGQPREVVSS